MAEITKEQQEEQDQAALEHKVMRQFFEDLAEAFPLEDLEWRCGSVTKKEPFKGMALPYLTSRAVQERFDRVAGPENWNSELIELTQSKGCFARITLTCPNGAVCFKTDGAPQTDIEGVKGGISDAIKRCAVQFGVGRYLYKLPMIWLAVEKRGNTHIFVKDALEDELEKRIKNKTWPPFALPQGHEDRNTFMSSEEKAGSFEREVVMDVDSEVTEERSAALFVSLTKQLIEAPDERRLEQVGAKIKEDAKLLFPPHLDALRNDYRNKTVELKGGRPD